MLSHPSLCDTRCTVRASGTQVEVEAFYKTGLDDLESLARKCEDAANSCVTGFDDLSNLSRECSIYMLSRNLKKANME